MFRTKRQLKKLQGQATPSRQFKHQLWTSLSAELEKEGVCTHKKVHFRFATVGLVVLVLLFGTGTGVYAYGSPEIVEGHPLHFMKSGIEKVEGVIMVTPGMKARFHSKMMSRRLDEGERHLHDRGKVEMLLHVAANELELSVEEVAQKMADPEMRVQLIDELSLRNVRYEELSTRVRVNDPEPCEDTYGGVTPLRNRAHQWGLSDQELTSLFQGVSRVDSDADCH
jgi:hypothetical protein